MQSKNQKNGLKPNRRDWTSYLPFSIIAILLIVILLFLPRFTRSLSGEQQNTIDLNYTEFRRAVQNGQIAQVQMSQNRMSGEFVNPLELTNENGDLVVYGRFTAYLPPIPDDSLLPLLEQYGVEVETRPANEFSWQQLLTNLLPLVLFGGLGYLIFRSVRGQGQGIFNTRSNRARLYDRKVEGTTFEDVAGERGAKMELQEIIQILRDPTRFIRLGATTPKGVLLVGPPGTGKTLLARAVAGEAGTPFYSITGSDFMEMFVGVGASRVRDLFAEAKKNAPAIIFIDELDSIGRKRNMGSSGAQEEREQTLNQLLSEMDGFSANSGVIVLGATNRPEILDPALLRAGRFDRRVTVDLPSLKEREEILQTHARNKPLAPSVHLGDIARGTPGFSGADLENLLNEAALMAARKDRDAIEVDDIEDARDKILMGLERDSILLTEEECRLIAYHEAGHAIMAAVLPNADPIHKVTIVPRGRAMGVTQQLPEREKFIYPREYMLDRLAVMMGGRAAEIIIFNSATSGAENDLKQSTQLARRMVLDWGMSQRLGNMALGNRSEQVFLGEETGMGREYSEETARIVDEEIKIILEEAFERARETLIRHRKEMDRLANLLVEKEIVSGREVLEIVGMDPTGVVFQSPKNEVLWREDQTGEGENDLEAPESRIQ